jgi:ABC-type multidrug transport system fused ATPase/permease subunit
MPMLTTDPLALPAAVTTGPISEFRPAAPASNDAGGRRPTGGPGGPWTLRALFRVYHLRILFTYALFNLENLLRMAKFYCLGWAINDLLRSSHVGLIILVAQHVGHLLCSSLRRTYDAQTFTGIYADLATRLVHDQRARGVEISRVAARSALSRVFVDFYERDVPLVVEAIYSVAGALLCLFLYDWVLLPLCLALVVPAFLVNVVYSQKTLYFNGRLNNELEREVEVIDRWRATEVRDHYRLVARWRTKLANWEALNFGLMEVFVLGLIVVALARYCTGASVAPGDVSAVFGYVMTFIMGLDSVPMLVQRVSLLRDIGRRVQEGRDEPLAA